MEGFTKVGEMRVSLLSGNVIGILISIPVTLLFMVAEFLLFGLPELAWWQLCYFATGFGIQIIIHESLHAIGYIFDGGLRRDQLKFGVNWKGLAPYCIFLSPIAMPPFRRAALLPTVVLFPLSVALWLIFQTWWLNFLAAAALVCGVGDFIVFIKSLKYPPNLFIVEHASGAGGDLFVAVHEQSH